MTKTEAQILAPRVAAGAKWLDERVPDWWKSIDLNRLSLISPCNCVLGQLDEAGYEHADRLKKENFGDYQMSPFEHYLDTVLAPGSSYSDQLRRAAALGFTTSVGDNCRTFAKLTVLWKELIAFRGRTNSPVPLTKKEAN